MKKMIYVVITLAMVFTGYLAFTTVDTETPVVNAAKKTTYDGTIYVAGMGGHFAVADVTVDPSNLEEPIKINDLDRIEVGSAKTHPIHDARIDVNDRNVTFWSTYKLDPDGNLHVGKSDLTTGKVLVDVAVPKPERVDQAIANYCASGQSKDNYMPISMSNEGFLDVWDKKTMKLKHRIFMDQLGFKSGTYTFAHGINTPDMTKFVVTVNLTPAGFQGWIGRTKLMMLDMKELEEGRIKILAENVITGTPVKTITFRQAFTPDGKYLLQSGGDRAYLLNGETLEAIDEITEIPGESHDLIGTPDSKYAVMTFREKTKNAEGKDIEDGTLMLYDIEAKKVIGKKSVSVCYSCHEGMVEKTSALCGMDANWK
jgi:hypothetical protein